MPNFISEDQIEQALLQRLQHVCGFDVLECHTTDPADLNDGAGWLDKLDELLRARLKAAALKLNPHLPETVRPRAVPDQMRQRFSPGTEPCRARTQMGGMTMKLLKSSVTP